MRPAKDLISWYRHAAEVDTNASSGASTACPDADVPKEYPDPSSQYNTVSEYLRIIDKKFRKMYIYPTENSESRISDLLSVCRDYDCAKWDFVRYAEDGWVSEVLFEPAIFVRKGEPRVEGIPLPEAYEPQEWEFLEAIADIFISCQKQGSGEPVLPEGAIRKLDRLTFQPIWF